MALHEQKQCPRCAANFECKSGSIELCQCRTVVLTEEQQQYIHSRYEDCLCAACLAILSTESNNSDPQANLAARIMR